MSNKDQTSSNSNSKLKTENVKLDNTNNSNLNQFLQSKKGRYSLISVLVLGVVLISGLFTYNLLKQNNTAQAANTAATAFNPSDCATYTSNGGTTASGVCFVKLYEKSGVLYRSLDIAPGEIVNVRNYYNNTTTASVTAANITDSMPANFTRTGTVTNNYVDAAPVTLNNNVFTGQNLSVAPGAGYFGYAADNTVTSSNLELGKKRYFNLHQCGWQRPSTGSAYMNVSANILLDGTWGNTGTNASNTSNTSVVCGVAGSGWTRSTIFDGLSSLDITGKRFVNIHQCAFARENYITNVTGSLFDGFWGNTGTKASNTSEAAPFCGNGGSGWTIFGNFNGIANLDLFGKRYINYEQCGYTRSPF